jgi:hypothetical protein
MPEFVMTSVSFSHLSLKPMDSRVFKPETLPQEPVAKRSQPANVAVLPQPEAIQSAVISLPSTVDMRFEFNALTQAWMLAMTDSGSGDVLRKISLKGLSGSNAGLHQTGHWIDKAV